MQHSIFLNLNIKFVFIFMNILFDASSYVLVKQTRQSKILLVLEVENDQKVTLKFDSITEKFCPTFSAVGYTFCCCLYGLISFGKQVVDCSESFIIGSASFDRAVLSQLLSSDWEFVPHSIGRRLSASSYQ